MRAAVVVWLVLVVAVAACTPTLSPSTAEVTDGQLQRLEDGEWVGVTRVQAGDRVRALTEAVLDVGRGELRLQAGAEATVGERAIELIVGDALAVGAAAWAEGGGGEDDALEVTVQDAVVTGSGAFRVRAGVTPQVAVYAGEAEVVRPGEGQRVAALRQLRLSTRRFDGIDDPLSYDARDPFDQRMLPGAIAFDAQIANLVAAIDTQYGAAAQPPAFYASFVSVEPPDLQALTSTAPTVTATGAVGPPADALIGLFLARAAADAGDLDLLQAGEHIRRLRGEGARWGLVALALGVSSVDFAGIVDRAVARREEVVAAAPVVEPPPAAPAAGGGPALTPAPPAPAPAPPPPPPPAAGPPPEVPPVEPGTVGDLLEDVLDLVPDPLGVLGVLG